MINHTEIDFSLKMGGKKFTLACESLKICALNYWGAHAKNG